jgi:hypothetical protein
VNHSPNWRNPTALASPSTGAAFGPGAAVLAVGAQRRVHLSKRTGWPAVGVSESGQEETLALQQTAPLFNNLVGSGEQRGRYFDPEYPCGLQVDDELELGRPHHWHIGRFLALEHAASIDAGLASLVGLTR